MGQIYRIQSATSGRGAVDQQVIQTLRDSVGELRYQELAEDAAFMLAERLGWLERCIREPDYKMSYRHALNICGIADKIGLRKVSEVARDAMICAKTEDRTALFAVTKRLNQLVEVSLPTVFEDDS